jgi:putative endonuclease
MTGEADEYFMGIADDYQRERVRNRAVGKIGTAAYSLDVVSHSMFEQALATGNGIVLQEVISVPNPDNNGFHNEFVPLEVRFGSYVSDGRIGVKETLDKDRTVAQVLSGRQNLMVDDEKEGIAHRVGLNQLTMKVDKVLCHLRFDKGEDGHNISFLFISQPAVKRFVELMESTNSNTFEYDPQRQKHVLEQVYQEYGVEEMEVEDKDADMTNAKMTEEIKESTGWQVYVLRCGDGSLYCGIASDVMRRLEQHEGGTGARYTRGRGPLTLMIQWGFPTRSAALKAELAFKRLSRVKKEAQLLSGEPPWRESQATAPMG